MLESFSARSDGMEMSVHGMRYDSIYGQLKRYWGQDLKTNSAWMVQ